MSISVRFDSLSLTLFTCRFYLHFFFFFAFYPLNKACFCHGIKKIKSILTLSCNYKIMSYFSDFFFFWSLYWCHGIKKVTFLILLILQHFLSQFRLFFSELRVSKQQLILFQTHFSTEGHHASIWENYCENYIGFFHPRMQ